MARSTAHRGRRGAPGAVHVVEPSEDAQMVPEEMRETVDIAPRMAGAAGPRRVIVADDHAIFREGLKGLLEREGFDVVAEASDGREAVRLAQECRQDVASLDLAMPVIDGADAAGDIARGSPPTPRPLLTMSAEEP